MEQTPERSDAGQAATDPVERLARELIAEYHEALEVLAQ